MDPEPQADISGYIGLEPKSSAGQTQYQARSRAYIRMVELWIHPKQEGAARNGHGCRSSECIFGYTDVGLSAVAGFDPAPAVSAGFFITPGLPPRVAVVLGVCGLGGAKQQGRSGYGP